MCGRFALSIPLNKIAEYFQAINTSNLQASYNIAPGQEIAAVINDTCRKIINLKWGFIPTWAKDPAIGYRMINAKSETLAEKPSFREALKKRRCIIPATGFFEWNKSGKEKTPFYIHMKDDSFFSFAGLYEYWQDREGKTLSTCTIITTCSNTLINTIHNRMPVILSEEQALSWIDMSLDISDVLPLLIPYNPDEILMEEVSLLVNSPRNNSPECIKSVK